MRTIKASPASYRGVKKTTYQDGSTNPTIIGVYERDFTQTDEPERNSFSYFDGEFWFISWATPDQANLAKSVSKHQSLPWRGLTRSL